MNDAYPLFTFDDILALQCAMRDVKDTDSDLYNALRSLHDRVHDAYHSQIQQSEENLDS